MAQAKRPAHEIRRGPIKATIWEDKGKDGVFYKFTVARLYKDGDERFMRPPASYAGKNSFNGIGSL
jgi:hypothetical protein